MRVWLLAVFRWVWGRVWGARGVLGAAAAAVDVAVAALSCCMRQRSTTAADRNRPHHSSPFNTVSCLRAACDKAWTGWRRSSCCGRGTRLRRRRARGCLRRNCCSHRRRRRPPRQTARRPADRPWRPQQPAAAEGASAALLRQHARASAGAAAAAAAPLAYDFRLQRGALHYSISNLITFHEQHCRHHHHHHLFALQLWERAELTPISPEHV